MRHSIFLIALSLLCGIASASPVRDDSAAKAAYDESAWEIIVPVEYVANTGGMNYFNLLFKKSDVPDIVMEVKFSNCAYAGNQYKYYNGLLGWCEATNGYSTGLRVGSNGIVLVDGRNADGETIIEYAPPVDIEATLSSSGAIVNGVEIPDYRMSLLYSYTFPLGLFCFSSSVNCTPKGGSAALSCGRGRFHYLRVYSGDELVFYFQPVRFLNENRQWEGAVLDLISGELFRNQGTGSFAIGPDL